MRISDEIPMIGVVVDYFWPRYMGTWAHSDGTFVNVKGELQDMTEWDETQFFEDIEVSQTGTIDAEGAAEKSGGYYWFEVKKTLNSGDIYDWAVEPGQVIGNNPSDSLLFGALSEGVIFLRNIQMQLGE